jgi:hypothetical protein
MVSGQEHRPAKLPSAMAATSDPQPATAPGTCECFWRRPGTWRRNASLRRRCWKTCRTTRFARQGEHRDRGVGQAGRRDADAGFDGSAGGDRPWPAQTFRVRHCGGGVLVANGDPSLGEMGEIREVALPVRHRIPRPRRALSLGNRMGVFRRARGEGIAGTSRGVGLPSKRKGVDRAVRFSVR